MESYPAQFYRGLSLPAFLACALITTLAFPTPRSPAPSSPETFQITKLRLPLLAFESPKLCGEIQIESASKTGRKSSLFRFAAAPTLRLKKVTGWIDLEQTPPESLIHFWERLQNIPFELSELQMKVKSGHDARTLHASSASYLRKRKAILLENASLKTTPESAPRRFEQLLLTFDPQRKRLSFVDPASPRRLLILHQYQSHPQP